MPRLQQTTDNRDLPSSSSSRFHRPRTVPSRLNEPPSSPPPSSPLPLPPISPSPNSSSRLRTPPPRPPRPQISLPDLRPAHQDIRGSDPISCQFVTSSYCEIPTLQSPFLSSGNTPVHCVPHDVLTDSPSTNPDKSVIRNQSNTLSLSPGNKRIWWSHAITSPVPFDHSQPNWPLGNPAPPIPPKSAKRRSRRPPQKAIARSPLHIPSHLASSSAQLDTAMGYSKEASLLHDEPITSLPPWPNTDQLVCVQGQNNTAPLPPPLPRGYERQTTPPRTPQNRPCVLPSGTRGLEVAKRHISFCAVTNLGDMSEAKEAALPKATNPESTTTAIGNPVLTSWYGRHKKQLRVLATIAAVLIGAGGILFGVLWKLTHG